MHFQHSAESGWCVQVWVAGCCWLNTTWKTCFLQATASCLMKYCHSTCIQYASVCACPACASPHWATRRQHCLQRFSCHAEHTPVWIHIKAAPRRNPPICTATRVAWKHPWRKRSFTQDVVDTCFNGPWHDKLVQNLSLTLQQKSIKCRGFRCKKKHTLYFQIIDIRDSWNNPSGNIIEILENGGFIQ